MWSLGCVATAILTGSSPFSFNSRKQDNRRSSSEMIIADASACRLDGLEAAPEWKQIINQPKDFIRRLLVLNEDTRMTAKEALGHGWFTNSAVEDYYQALYRRAIAGWRKQALPPEIVEFIPGFSTPSKKVSTSSEPASQVQALTALLEVYWKSEKEAKESKAHRAALPTKPQTTEPSLSSTITVRPADNI